MSHWTGNEKNGISHSIVLGNAVLVCYLSMLLLIP